MRFSEISGYSIYKYKNGYLICKTNFDSKNEKYIYKDKYIRSILKYNRNAMLIDRLDYTYKIKNIFLEVRLFHNSELLKIEYYNRNKELLRVDDYLFNKLSSSKYYRNNLLIKEIEYFFYKVKYTHEYAYNNKNSIIEEKVNGESLHTYVYEYLEKSIKKIEFNKNNVVSIKIEKFNDLNELVESCFIKNEEIISTSKYRYDDQGNKVYYYLYIKNTPVTDGKPYIEEIKYEISYY